MFRKNKRIKQLERRIELLEKSMPTLTIINILKIKKLGMYEIVVSITKVDETFGYFSSVYRNPIIENTPFLRTKPEEEFFYVLEIRTQRGPDVQIERNYIAKETIQTHLKVVLSAEEMKVSLS